MSEKINKFGIIQIVNHVDICIRISALNFTIHGIEIHMLRRPEAKNLSVR